MEGDNDLQLYSEDRNKFINAFNKTMKCDSHGKIRRLQELFRGRFSTDEAHDLLEHFQWNSQEAVKFVMEADPRTVRDIIGTENGAWQLVRNTNVWRELIRQVNIPNEERQFSCQACDNVWWRKVPSRKPVSKCRRCRSRYDAVPRTAEWGLAKYVCQACGHVFRGFGQMNNTWSPCYRCATPCQPNEIYPRRRRVSRRRSRDTHSCLCANCVNKADGALMPGICVHPQYLHRRVVIACQPHTSTGSTVDTFLTQDDLMSQVSDFNSLLSDIDEGSDNGE